MLCLTTNNTERQTQFDELNGRSRGGGTPGDRRPGAGPPRPAGTVVRTERRRHGLHFQRNVDDKVFSDAILLELPDGELTSVTIDEFTTIRRA